jgi:hypothetical protein
MVIHFELHKSWTSSKVLSDAYRLGVSLGKDNHWHYNGVTGLYIFSDGFLIIEIIEKPSDIKPAMVRGLIRSIQKQLLKPRETKK